MRASRMRKKTDNREKSHNFSKNRIKITYLEGGLTIHEACNYFIENCSEGDFDNTFFCIGLMKFYRKNGYITRNQEKKLLRLYKSIKSSASSTREVE